MSYLFFLYGLSFFLMGFSILLYPKKGSEYKFTENIWLVGAFGMTHGIGEWVEMFALIDREHALWLQSLSLLCLALSFLFLLCFGLRMIDQKFEKYPLPYLLPVLAIFPIIVLLLVSQSSDSFLAGNIFIRYCIGFPGILLTSYAFYLRIAYLKGYHLKRVRRALKVFIYSFVLYSIAAGVIVPDAPYLPASLINYTAFYDLFGFPVQLLRAAIAIVSMYAIIETLTYFSIDAEMKLNKLASTDNLTGLFNRMKFDEYLQHQISMVKRYHHPLSIILFDVDNFKQINDTYGHPEGDTALKFIAAILKTHIRENDICARWGGEEFVVLLPSTHQEEATEFANRLRAEIEAHHFKNLRSITASFGVAEYKETEPAHTFIKRVDDALYMAKAEGKNRVSVYTDT